jgi:hypothetical protein
MATTRRLVGDEDLLERIDDEAETVWTLEWDSGSLGAGGGEDSACRLGGRYYAVLADSGETWGPFKSLTAALRAGDLNVVTGAAISARSAMLKAPEVGRLLRPASGLKQGHVLLVNGESWVFGGKRFWPAKPGEELDE